MCINISYMIQRICRKLISSV